MKNTDKFVGTTFKLMLVLDVLVIAFQKVLRPDTFRIVSFLVGGFSGVLLVYILGRWTQTKLGLFQGKLGEIDTRSYLNLLAVFCTVMALLTSAEYYIHNWSLTQQAVADIQASEDGRNLLGDSIRIGWLISFRIEKNGNDGTGRLFIPVKGSKAAGELEVKGILKDGAWNVSDLYLIVDRNQDAVQIPH